MINIPLTPRPQPHMPPDGGWKRPPGGWIESGACISMPPTDTIRYTTRIYYVTKPWYGHALKRIGDWCHKMAARSEVRVEASTTVTML